MVTPHSPELTNGYQQARLTIVVTTGLTLLWRSGLPFKGRLPVLDIDLTEGAKLLPYVLPPTLAYGVVRLLIEWWQSAPERRQRWASRLDLFVTLGLAAVAAWILGVALTPIQSIRWTTLVPAATLVLIGTVAGIYLEVAVSGLWMIRSRSEARRLMLPRIPVAVRASWKMGLIVGPAVFTVALLAPAFAPPINRIWVWLLATPMVLLFVVGLIDEWLPSRRTLPDGSVVSRRNRRRRLRAVYDKHDASYQMGGWDNPAQGENTPLYNAAEVGDLQTVRTALDSGADPNVRNALGWTALLIAVAQRHRAVAAALLTHGADPNQENLLGRTPLMFAARYSDPELVALLLDHGAVVDAVSPHDSETALFAVARSGNTELVERLLRAGADPSYRDRDGRYPDQHAEGTGQGEAARILRRARLAKGAR